MEKNNKFKLMGNSIIMSQKTKISRDPVTLFLHLIIKKSTINNNLKTELDNVVSYRYILYERKIFYQTDKIIQRGPQCPSISLIRQSAEVILF